MRAICKELGINPDTVYAWVHDHPEFSEQYARAKEFQCQILADEIIEIADTPQSGVIITEREGKDGLTRETRTIDMVEHRRLAVDARKWTLSKLMPKRYGEFERTEVSGPRGGPVEVNLAEVIEARRRAYRELNEIDQRKRGA